MESRPVTLPRMDKPPIEPLYKQAKPSEQIDLGAFDLEFTIGGEPHNGRADVSMRFTPDQRLCFIVPLDAISTIVALKAFADDARNNTLKLTERGVTVDAYIQSMGGTGLTFTARTSGITATAPSTNVVRAIFHLFNFPKLCGPQDYWLSGVQGSGQRCGRLTLSAGGWTLMIAATGQTDEACKALRSDGGLMITHAGQVVRDDSSQLSSEQLTDFLHCVRTFLSFALGRWAGVALPVGFDVDGKRVFEQWGIPKISAGPSNVFSWFDCDHSQALTDAFPGFFDLWKNEMWHSALRKALYWYVGANVSGAGVGVDGGLILAQAAFEQLAWTYCVRDRKMVSESAFGTRGLSAADKMRLLLSALEIPADLPDRLKALHGRRGKKWSDGPDAVTGVRNALVHPSEKDELPEGAYFEAWQLSMWFLDLVLLRLCGYAGEYANRLALSRWVGQVEPVPWGQA